MAKFTKIITSIMVMAALLIPTTEVAAQKRKTTTAKKTSTAKTQAKPAAKPAAKPFDLSDKYYEGLLKIKGQPMDIFGALTLNESEGSFDFAGAVQLPFKYTAKEAGGKVTLTFSSEKLSATLTSTDKGGSFEGTISMAGNSMQAWLLSVNPDHKIPDMTDEELLEVVSNPDGYTVFVIGEQGGQKVMFPADMTLNGDTKTYSTKFDNAIVQNIFGKFYGKYEVKDKKLYLSDSEGTSSSGPIYDNGTYILIPMGSAQGFNFTICLMR